MPAPFNLDALLAALRPQEQPAPVPGDWQGLGNQPPVPLIGNPADQDLRVFNTPTPTPGGGGATPEYEPHMPTPQPLTMPVKNDNAPGGFYPAPDLGVNSWWSTHENVLGPKRATQAIKPLRPSNDLTPNILPFQPRSEGPPPGLLQLTQNDNAPGGFDPVLAQGAMSGNMGEVHNRSATRRNMMSPTEVWAGKRRLAPFSTNDNANFFGGWGR